MSDSVIHSDPEIMSGWPVFVGTRVPIQNLFDYLASGEQVEEFLDDFPSVSREQMLAALKEAQELMEAHAYSAGRMHSEEDQEPNDRAERVDDSRNGVERQTERGVA